MLVDRFLNTQSHKWDYELMEELGDLAPESTLPLAESGETRPLSQSAAVQLGLPKGLPVDIGVMDVAAAGYAFCGEQPGKAWAIVGTTSFVGVVRTELDEAVGNWMAYGPANMMLNSLAPMTGTPLLEWAKRLIGMESESWESFSSFARDSSKTMRSPLLLPYFSPSGERSPFSDPYARGSLHGLTYDTTPADFAWSAFAGIALTIAECLEYLDTYGSISIAGGGSSSDLLCQLVSDFSGKRIERSALSAEAGVIGATRKLHYSLGKEQGSISEYSVKFEPNISSNERANSLDRLRTAREAEQPVWQMFGNNL
jgi:erythritol kinase